MEKAELKLKDKSYDCPLCENELPIRIDKRKKPYVICDDCGLQMFIRYPKGIDRLCKEVQGFWG